MKREAYIGIIQNERWDAKTIVLAASVEEARKKVMATFDQGLGVTFWEEDIRIILFADRNVCTAPAA